MEINKELGEVFALLDRRALSVAMEHISTFGYKYPEIGLDSSLDEIRSDYERMMEYWTNGFRDPQLDSIYDGLVTRMYRLTADVVMRYAQTHSTYLSSVGRRVAAARRDWSLPVLRDGLEAFVSDVAMLEFEPEQVRAKRSRELYAEHQRMMSDLFDYILISPQWTDGMTDAFADILLSPTVDSTDQQVIVSAVMMSAMNIFDMNKFRLLTEVYRKSTDENVRQRALVAWVLAMGDGREGVFFERKKLLVAEMLADSNVRAELTELQIQMLYCVSAEDDTRTIQKEIMPDLLKHNNLHITRNGIEEREEDPMQDVLDPEASERSMEKVEESFRKMVDMQKAGSDIYFGGFSQMKRFPFFDNISNWFVPFYPEHPDIASLYEKPGDNKIARMVIDNGPFCDSDKYSFMLAFRQVMDRIPANMREMLSNGEAMGLGSVDKTDKHTPAYIRRVYLQDLYRFFRLFPSRSMFANPFDTDRSDRIPYYIFFSNSLLRATEMGSSLGDIAAFMIKRKDYAGAAAVLGNYDDGVRDYQYYMLCGNVLLNGNNRASVAERLPGVTAEQCFGRALELRPDDTKALVGYARSWFYEGNYTEASAAYGRLLEANPDSRTFRLNFSVCLTNLERYDEAMRILYKLNYEYPEDINVSRVMARALVGTGKYEQARKIYETMEEAGKSDDGDMVNRGYCEWFAGNNKAAADCFARCLKARYPDAGSTVWREQGMTDVMVCERQFIKSHGITETDIQLMLDLICDAILR